VCGTVFLNNYGIQLFGVRVPIAYSSTMNVMKKAFNHTQCTVMNELFSELLIDCAPVGIITVNDRFKITRFNRWATQITGYSEQETLGQYCGEILHGGLCSTNCPLKTVLGHEKPMIGLETTIKSKEGKSIPVQMNMAGLFDDKDRLIGGVEAFHDISYTKTLEHERNNVVSMFAHDLKNSVITISGFAHRLLLKQPEQTLQKKYLQIIEKEASRLETLINDFLNFSRLQTGKLTLNLSATSIDKELLELYEIYLPRARQKKLHLEFVSEKPLPVIEADSAQLRRVFSNLIDNAVKFSTSCTIAISTGETDREITVSVKDEGVGIDEADLPFIFETFHRCHNDIVQDGFGLGLAGAKAIIDAHGGRITVESTKGTGSCFTVRLSKIACRA